MYTWDRRDYVHPLVVRVRVEVGRGSPSRRFRRAIPKSVSVAEAAKFPLDVAALLRLQVDFRDVTFREVNVNGHFLYFLFSVEDFWFGFVSGRNAHFHRFVVEVNGRRRWRSEAARMMVETEISLR